MRTEDLDHSCAELLLQRISSHYLKDNRLALAGDTSNHDLSYYEALLNVTTTIACLIHIIGNESVPEMGNEAVTLMKSCGLFNELDEWSRQLVHRDGMSFPTIESQSERVKKLASVLSSILSKYESITQQSAGNLSRTRSSDGP